MIDNKPLMTDNELLTILGYHHTMYDGDHVWADKRPDLDIMIAVEAVSGQFLAVDLDNDINAPAIGVELGKDVFDTLKARQCQLIREARLAAYRTEADDLFFDAEADGTQDGEARKLWLAKREEIKKRYPWPGNYR